jgi:hypothetical protein
MLIAQSSGCHLENRRKSLFRSACEKGYSHATTKLLDQALEVARSLPSEAQDDIGRLVLQLAGWEDVAPVALSADERAAVEASKEAAARGEFATDGQVRAVWAKHGL